MRLRVAVQMDPIERINIRGDSTFALLLEAQARGHEIAYYTPDRLALRGDEVFASVRPLHVRDQEGNHCTLGEPERANLAAFDVVLLRQDPPFDLAYITTTHLLERIQKTTLVVNDPAEVRNAPEKMFVMAFPDLMPPTLITRDLAEIKAFRAEHGDIVMKPLYGKGGEAVFRLAREDLNFGSLYDLFAVTFREAWVVQKFFPPSRTATSASFWWTANLPAPSTGCRRRTIFAPTWCEEGPRRDRPHAARARDLRNHRRTLARPRASVRRHRCDRRLSHRDQRDVAYRHPRGEESGRAGRGRHGLGSHRGGTARLAKLIEAHRRGANAA